MVHVENQRNSKRCVVCGSEEDIGITIWNELICHQCEKEMVRTDVDDEKYPFFIQRMRSIWLKKDA